MPAASKPVEKEFVTFQRYTARIFIGQAIPDLRAMRKKERTPIQKEAINRLKNNLRKFLSEVSKQGFEFEVNGKILDARLYSTGINEVLEKVTKEKAGMLYSTEEIFRNARYLYSTPDYDGDPNVFRWNYFYTPVQIGEDIVGVRIAVRDVAAVVSDKRLDLFVQTTYINKKGSIATPESVQADSFTSETSGGTAPLDTPLDGVQPIVSDSSHGVSSGVSNDNIPQSNPVVNPSQDPAAYLASIVPKPQGGNTDQRVADYMASIVPTPKQRAETPPVDTSKQTDYDNGNLTRGGNSSGRKVDNNKSRRGSSPYSQEKPSADQSQNRAAEAGSNAAWDS